MSAQEESQLCRVPSLTQYCYRCAHRSLISPRVSPTILSLGDTPYPLCEPILRSCSAEQLLALEKNSSCLESEDRAVWQALCFRDFPRSKSQYEKREFPEPECWRKQYFVCRGSEEKRLEEVGTRIRCRREEVDQEKKDRQVVYTDRLPPSKRARFNPGPSKPKCLIEKTRAESIKIQRLVYGPSMLPPMSTKAVKPRLVSPPKAAHAQAGPCPSPVKLPASNGSPAIESKCSSPPAVKPLAPPSTGGHGAPKKDPMATLFMPKHRAHSQLPTDPRLPIRRK
ncbi:RNA polymerase II transcription factor SIII subunit A-domain-containing protein [Gautieria morchelliformis]|nr:RNA polymerase II transcription factor SIII subunit A-domain-containing protein [Gautieria morchelliformis]